jgi:hypothetical protein
VLEAAQGTRLERTRLVAEVQRLDGEAESLRREIEALDRLDLSLAQRDVAARELVSAVLHLRLKAVRAEIEAAMAAAEQARNARDRVAGLVERGAAPVAQLEEEGLALTSAEAQVARLRAEAARLEKERAGALEGSAGDLALGDGSYARQRRDELAIRRADLLARKERALAAAAAARSMVEAFPADADAFVRFAPTFAADMVAWSASPLTGARVAAGTEVVRLLDCSRRFVEVPIREGAFEAIGIGEVAEVHFKGAPRPVTARVAAGRGAGSQPARGELAAAPIEVADGMLSVLLDLPPADVTDAEVSARFCDVGRSAQVKLSRDLPERLAGWSAEVRAVAARVRDTVTGTTAWWASLLGRGGDGA